MSWKLYPINRFNDYQNDWQRLNSEASASPLLSLEFVLPLLQIFGDGTETLACYEEENKPQAMAVICSRRQWVWTTFQPSQAPLGLWIQKPNLDWSYLLSTLIRKLAKHSLVLGITQQDPEITPRPKSNNKLITLDYIQTARITLEGSFEDYWASRGKNLRQNMKKQRNKLVKDGMVTRLEVCQSPTDVQQAIFDYGQLENVGWKVAQGTAIHPSNRQGHFYKIVLENFCRQGRGRIYKYWLNNQIIAMDLCVEGRDNIVILKTTYDEGLGKSISPAFLMREEEFKQLFDEQKIKRIEFYGSVMDWHTKWSNEIRTLYHVNRYRWSILPFLQNTIKKSFQELVFTGK